MTTLRHIDFNSLFTFGTFSYQLCFHNCFLPFSSTIRDVFVETVVAWGTYKVVGEKCNACAL